MRAPKDGTGWEEGAVIIDGVRRWRTPIGDDLFLMVTVTESLFTISRVRGMDHETPAIDDIARVEKEFGVVHGWRVRGTFRTLGAATGYAVMLEAVDA